MDPATVSALVSAGLRFMDYLVAKSGGEQNMSEADLQIRTDLRRALAKAAIDEGSPREED